MKKLILLLIAFMTVLFVSCKESEDDALEVYTAAVKDYGERESGAVTLDMQGKATYQGKDLQTVFSMDCEFQKNPEFGFHGTMKINMETPDGVNVTIPAEIYMVTEGEDLAVYTNLYNQWYFVPLAGFSELYSEFLATGLMDGFYDRLPELVSCEDLGKTDFNGEKVRKIEVTYLEDYIGKVLEIYDSGDLDVDVLLENSGLTKDDLDKISSMLDGISYDAFINKNGSLVGYDMDLGSIFKAVVNNVDEFNDVTSLLDISGSISVALKGDVPEEIVVPPEVADNAIYTPLY